MAQIEGERTERRVAMLLYLHRAAPGVTIGEAAAALTPRQAEKFVRVAAGEITLADLLAEQGAEADAE